MMSFFSIDRIVFTFLSYPMSYIELLGTLFYLWSVWLIAQKKMLTWPIGILSVILYGILFYQIQLYSDCLEQIYYMGASVYGWWFWNKGKNKDEDIKVVRGSRVNNLIWLTGILMLSGLTGFFMSRVHLILPRMFPLPADFPFLDALTTVSSFAAMFLLARKRVESWAIWIVVDIIGIGLYYTKGVKFIALLYVFLLILAIRGLISWLKEKESSPPQQGIAP